MNFTSQSWKEAPKAVMQAVTTVHVINGFVPTDDYATNLARSIGNASVDGNADFTFTEDVVDDADGTGLEITFAGASATRTGTAAVSDDLSVVFTDGTTFDVATNASGIEITTDNPNILIPSFTQRIRNPS